VREPSAVLGRLAELIQVEQATIVMAEHQLDKMAETVLLNQEVMVLALNLAVAKGRKAAFQLAGEIITGDRK
jgi:hypothetical protein